MDGQRRVGKPLEVRREFVGCRLESQVLVRAYELGVPVICRQACATRRNEDAAAGSLNRAGLVAQGV